MPLAKEGPETGLPSDGHCAESGHRQLRWKVGWVQLAETGWAEQGGAGSDLVLLLRNPLKRPGLGFGEQDTTSKASPSPFRKKPPPCSVCRCPISISSFIG